jgi:hypothetical protein
MTILDVGGAVLRTPDIDASPDRSALSLTRFYQSSGSREIGPDSGADKLPLRSKKSNYHNSYRGWLPQI